jgi:hypothetical protein
MGFIGWLKARISSDSPRRQVRQQKKDDDEEEEEIQELIAIDIQ